jgi:hypothetical protein
MGIVDQATKRCSTCREIRPLTEFNKLAKAKDGRQYNCRECNKRYHHDNWERHMEQIRARRLRRRTANRRYIFEYLSSHPCVDCGEADLLVLEFDHIGDEKNDNVGRLISTAELARVVEEIELCEVVCANCHRRRTAARADRNYRRDMTSRDVDQDDEGRSS